MTATPLRPNLTPNGKTLAVFCGHRRAQVIARMLAVMGDPELVCPGDHDPDAVAMVWPYQDMPADVKEAAEETITANLLNYLAFDKPEGGQQ